MNASAEISNCSWRADIDSLTFRPEGHNGVCVIHRRAFRTLFGFLPEPHDCCAYFETQRDIFRRAAATKIARNSLRLDGNFHLNSRDIRLEFT